MSASHASGGVFALDQGELRGESPFVVCEPHPSTPGEMTPMILLADPVDLVPGAADVARDVLGRLAVYLRHAPVEDPRQVLGSAFSAANERVLAENRSLPPLRRIYLGLTCLVLRGDELFVAQCAPSQALVLQDGLAHALPALDTWTSRDLTETFSDLSYPLGFRSSVQPRMSYSRVAPGDTLAALSWPVALVLGQSRMDLGLFDARRLIAFIDRLDRDTRAKCSHGAIFEVRQGYVSRDGLGGPSERQVLGRLPIDERGRRRESIGAFERIRKTERSGIHERARAVSQNWPETGGQSGHGFDTLETRQFNIDVTDELPDIRFQAQHAAGGAPSLILPASTARFTEPDAQHVSMRSRGSLAEDSYTAAAERRAAPDRRAGARGYIVEIFAGLLLSLSAAVVGVWQITKRDRPIHGPRDDGTLGLPHLQKWSDSYQPPRFERVRRASPRFQVNGFLIVGLLLAVLAVSVVLIVNAYNTRTDDRSAGIDARLQTISAVRTQAETAANSRSAHESLSGALIALDDLAAAAPTDEVLERIHDERAAVSSALEQLTGTRQLTSVQVMGSLPPAAEGVTARLFTGNNRIFVLSGGFFELDPISGTLIQLLVPGDVVGGSPVGSLLAAAWNDDRPVVVDSHNVFMLDPSTGEWHRVPLGLLSPDGYDDITSMAVFNRNIYYLTAESGHILKFDALDFSASPEDWAAGSSRDFLYNGVDLIVDGSIHVAQRDGSVLTFFRSALDRTAQVEPLPALDSVTALTFTASGDYMFLINGSDGRIVTADRDGNVVNQYVTASGAPSLAGATDLVVNEANGITYVISNDTLYAVRLALPGS